MSGCRTKQASEDADVLIVQTAKHETANVKAVIIGNDTDLLILLCQLAQGNMNIIYQTITGGKNPNHFYNSNSFKHANLKEVIAFVYAFTGCNTTSAVYNVGKNKILNCMLDHTELKELALCFFKAIPNYDKIVSNGIEIMRLMYMTESDKSYERVTKNKLSLNDLRFHHFQKSTKKKKIAFKLESLPPTEGATAQHSLRTYLQIQMWLGKNSRTQKNLVGKSRMGRSFQFIPVKT